MPFVLSLAAIAVFAAAAVTDALWRQIPNGLSIALAGFGMLRLVLALCAGGAWLAAGLDLAAAAAVFGLAAWAFSARLIGGGDVKLLTAGTLWLGGAALGPFLLSTVLAGGLLAVGFVCWQVVAGRRTGADRPSLPYAIAIAAGGIFATAGSLWS